MLVKRPEPGDPVAVRLAVVIGKGEDFSLGGAGPGVARSAEAAGFEADEADRWEIFRDEIASAIDRAIIHDDRFESTTRHFLDRSEALADAVMTVTSADDDAEEVEGGGWRAERKTLERRFRVSRAVGQAEVPVQHLRAIVPPAVAPSVGGHAGSIEIPRGAGGPAQSFCLASQPVTARIQAELRNHQRPVTRDVMESSDIVTERRLVLQIHIEGAEVRILRL